MMFLCYLAVPFSGVNYTSTKDKMIKNDNLYLTWH